MDKQLINTIKTFLYNVDHDHDMDESYITVTSLELLEEVVEFYES